MATAVLPQDAASYFGPPHYFDSGRPYYKSGEVSFTVAGDYGLVQQQTTCTLGLDDIPEYPVTSVENHTIMPNDILLKPERLPGEDDDYADYNPYVISVVNGLGAEERRELGSNPDSRMVREAIKNKLKYIAIATDRWSPEPGATYSTLAAQAGGLRTLYTHTNIPTGALVMWDLPDPDMTLDDPNANPVGRDRDRLTAILRPVDVKDVGETFQATIQEIIKNGEKWKAAWGADYMGTGAMTFAAHATMKSYGFACLMFMKRMIDAKKARLEDDTLQDFGLSRAASGLEQMAALAQATAIVPGKYDNYEYQNFWRDTCNAIYYDGTTHEYYVGHVPGGNARGYNPETKTPSSDVYGDLNKLQRTHFIDAVGALENVHVHLVANRQIGKCVKGNVKGRTIDVILGANRL